MNSLIHNTVTDYYQTALLESYGIYVFSLNEGLSDNLQQYKQGVIKAIDKMKSKIGDSAGYIVSSLINNAKKQGNTALIAILMALSVFGGTESASAMMSNKQAELFIQHCSQLYDGEKNVKARLYNDLVNQGTSMVADTESNYYSGYAVNKNLSAAKSEARRQAMQYYKDDHSAYPGEFDINFTTNLQTDGQYRVLAVIKVNSNASEYQVKADQNQQDTAAKKEIDLTKYDMYVGQSEPFTASPESTKKAMVGAYKVAINDYNTKNHTNLTNKQLDEMGSELKFAVKAVQTKDGPRQICICKLYLPKN